MSDENQEVFKEIEIDILRDKAMDVVRLLDEGDVIPGLSGYYEVLYEENRPDSDRTRLMLYFPIQQISPASSIELLLSAVGSDDHIIRETSVNKKDYLEAYKEYYEPFRISERLVIVPSWDRDSDRARNLIGEKDIPLYLDPGLAFGTGKHPTTELCLNFLDTHATRGFRMIDAGCGSGILAIGALLLGAGEIYAFDVDGNAVNAVRQNMELNDVVSTNLIVEGGGFDLPRFLEFEADLFVGNLTQNIIFSAIDYINRGKYEHMILSGILSEKKGEVIEAFSDGWNHQYAEDLDGWCLLEFKRK